MLGEEVLDVNRFPWISFHSVSIQRLKAGEWLVRGDLELHGQIRPVTVNVASKGRRYTGSARVQQSDFKITPIRILGGTVNVKDEVIIDVDIATIEP